MLCGLYSVELTSAQRAPHDTPMALCVDTDGGQGAPREGPGRREGLALRPRTWEQRPRSPAWGGLGTSNVSVLDSHTRTEFYHETLFRGGQGVLFFSIRR